MNEPSSPESINEADLGPNLYNSREERIEVDGRNQSNEVDDDSGIEESSEQVLLDHSSDKYSDGRGRSGGLSPKLALVMASIQIIFPFLVAGLGCVFAGMLLDYVEHWPLFTDITELYILVPSLLGLKGNLEMTLSSRLSTAANLGHLDKKARLLKIVFGNMALMQGQVLIVSASSAVFALLLDWIADGDFCLVHAVIIPAAALTTASIASAVLGTLMVLIIVVSRHLSINPDNVATPIAASLGDLVTLALLSYTSQAVYEVFMSSGPGGIVLSVAIIALFLALLPMWLCLAYKNKYTQGVVFSGLHPVFIAMTISSLGGLVLDLITVKFKGFPLYTPIINGVGGNLVAVQSSRISTGLHSSGSGLGKLPKEGKFKYYGVLRTFGSNPHGNVAKFLLVLSIPGSLAFLGVIRVLGLGHTSQTPIFYLFYCLAAVTQVVILLILANWLVHLLWRMGHDPDNSAIPYLTAAGDLLGTGLLAVAWLVLWSVGDRDNDVGE